MNLVKSLKRYLLPQISKIKEKSMVIRKCFILLSKKEVTRLKLVTLAQLILAFLDLAGVIAIGLIGTLSVYGIQSRSPSGQLVWILDFFKLSDWNLQSQVAIIGLVAATILISKTLISAWINQKTILFLSNRSADISIRIIRKLVFSNLEQIRQRSRFENIFAVTTGVQSITSGVIGTVINLFADIVLILIMFFGLLIIDPSIALVSVTLFGSIALLLYKLVNKRVTFLAGEGANIQISNGRLLYELFGSYREIFAGGIRNQYVDKLELTAKKIAKNSSSAIFLSFISKYVLEVAFVIGAICFVGIQFVLKDAVGAIASISIFIASSGRVIPAILRLQSAALAFQGSIVVASRTLGLITELSHVSNQAPETKNPIKRQGSFSGYVSMEGVDFRYFGNSNYALKDIDLEIVAGEWLAIVGPSGAGKTTLVDLLLGILKPTKGKVEISGLDPELCIKNWPGSISYVPQESFIFDASIEDNVALGVDSSEIDIDQIVSCLKLVGLHDYMKTNSEGTKFQVGELGSKLSGGQRQRLGIARALYTKPKLLILDEATSALDGSSEKVITECLSAMRGNVTIISIAHRLSTVVNANRVIYVEKGRIEASGTFQDIRNQVPNFETEAKISNITSSS
jgi:ABC-type bacteriocin/lantibiotic exporter with double-glycine peptidase domain